MLLRFSMYLLYTTALAAGIGCALILLDQFVTWLQTDTWPRLNLLNIAIDWHLIPRGWVRFPEIADMVFTVLRATPVSLALLAIAPLLWWLGNRVKRGL